MTPAAYQQALAKSGKGSGKARHSQGKLLFRKWLRVIIASTSYYTGLAFLSHSRARVRILMYHSIDQDPLDVHTVSPMAFEEQMHFLATRCNIIPLDQLVDHLDGKGSLPDNPVVITFDDGWANNYTVAYPILKKYRLPATMFVIPEWIASCEMAQTSKTQPNEKRHMTWDQIREMSRHGISIGAHTISHRSLPTLTLQKVRYELLESKARLEQQLGQPVRFFAYPYGAFRDLNRNIARMVAECGYACAVTSLSGTNGPSADLYALRRTEIEASDGMYVFGRVMAGGLDSWIVLQRLLWVTQVLHRCITKRKQWVESALHSEKLN